jgi:hypothetical protein
MKRKLALVGLLLVLVAGGVLYVRFRPQPASPPLELAEASRLLVNRNWLDVLPRDEKQRLHVYRFTPAMGGGVFQDRTLFAGQFELFTFRLDHDQIDFNLPHKGQRVLSKFEIRRVKGHEPFDLELTLAADPRGPHRYYGFSNESAVEADTEVLLHRRAPLALPPQPIDPEATEPAVVTEPPASEPPASEPPESEPPASEPPASPK